MRPTILLFDIDGTLLHQDGVGRSALSQGFAAAFGRPDATNGIPFAGNTDTAIFRAAFEAIGVTYDERAVARVVEAYLPVLADLLAASEATRLLPGVVDLLDALEAIPGTARGLGTGNVRAGARVKLQHLGLWERFAFGGFGEDGARRAEVLHHGASRGALHLGRPLAACRTVVIGDTVRDVEAGLAIGAHVVGVGTGGVPLGHLEAAGAHAVFDDLTAPGVLAALL